MLRQGKLSFTVQITMLKPANGKMKEVFTILAKIGSFAILLKILENTKNTGKKTKQQYPVLGSCRCQGRSEVFVGLPPKDWNSSTICM